jgi:hypothetical protein
MAITNRERVGKGLDLLTAGLQPFVEREMKAVHGQNWMEAAQQSFREGRGAGKAKGVIQWDAHAVLTVMCDQWNAVFGRTLGAAERSLASELREVRNRWAHQHNFTSNDAQRALDSIGRMLSAVSASSESAEVEQLRMDLLRTFFEEQRRTEMRKISFQPTEGKPQGGLKPWREVVTPHPDVASGRYQQAEFAADLWQVYKKEGSDEYKHPTEFFRRTFITEGLKRLLMRSLERLAGTGGDPVVELQTNFGGGKTHSMLALYHLFSGLAAGELPGVEDLLKESTGLKIAPGVRRAVFVGTQISPGREHKKPDGTIVRTIWGEIAWQLGGKEGYKLIADDDKNGTNPGDVLTQLFNKYSPCLILFDEWVAYARQLHGDKDLPAGTFETQFTFAQALTESVKAAKQTLLIISIPASESPHQKGDRVTDIEVGGERGREALARLKNAVGRVESSWRPASPDEGFEIVRRRLFQPLTGDQFTARDAVARAFSEMYGSQHTEFPVDCREADYERRLKMAYPIHPELFDRLYNDWSTLDKFQRTRGVLRLMASVIHSLWERHDGNLLILPANVPIDDLQVQFELTRYLDDNWPPVLEKDVDGVNSLPMAVDRETPNLGRYSACRRVARTIYMGSAPIQRASNRGIDDRQVKLGCVQPGESVATFGDALRRLTDKATYLYVDGKRYWYSTQPTVARLADDRAERLQDDDVEEEIKRLLRDEARSRGDFAKVHACAGAADIPDEKEARLVILGPQSTHSAKVPQSEARESAAAILASRGSSPRDFKNTLVFLAADRSRMKELDQAVRQRLAWSSILKDASGDTPSLNLDNFQKSQAETKRKGAEETVEVRIPETYVWLLVPGQPDPQGEVEWSEFRLQGTDALSVRASKKMKQAALLTIGWAGSLLRHELDRIPLWRGNHVSIKQLSDDLAKYLYLPRIKDESVLLEAIRDGLGSLMWQTEGFAYAEAWDESRGRYKGLKIGPSVRVLADGHSLLVKPDVAKIQMDADREQAAAKTGVQPASSGPMTAPAGGAPGEVVAGNGTTVVVPPQLRRFFGSVTIDPVRLGRDAGRIAEEVVQHLSSILGANVEISLEIRADLPQGASEKVVRDVTENCRTLKFGQYGFEEA